MDLRARVLKHESLGELERAGQARFEESFLLAVRGRRHAAAYLLGYYVEIALKTTFFRCFGFSVSESIRRKDLKAASQLVHEQLGIKDDHEQYHNPVFWANAIVRLREMEGLKTAGELSRELLWRAQRIASNWVVAMRYTDNLVRIEDWNAISEDALWLRANRVALSTKGSSGASR